MRIIFMVGVIAFLLGVYFKLKGIELVTLCITIALVFVAEMFNTAIEMVMDMITQKHDTLVKIIKDISAGVVLITSLNAIAIGYILFSRKIFKF
ncbi:MAG: diacylglycerol kinase family protein [Candidatus Omnitrophica bacterium]|nr:diacylglycerol kinase family protein [Candidatus Omnitrophota bacterium]